ncbi:uncharacterized protein EI90DRAFT_3017947 [Cantharellus anzutake]|uniref:uncharacterized protein n=1 Tax=Cantharellus anzutake TaxID=1750568 RepID=UPI001908210F|nr:uncharacterized protein EI90DRAFT_3017947 [Cantharellus anzutake]KAF8327955.1 hypothetical protein EI90DRAFT_3017947 [Cantharellus anzutake]
MEMKGLTGGSQKHGGRPIHWVKPVSYAFPTTGSLPNERPPENLRSSLFFYTHLDTYVNCVPKVESGTATEGPRLVSSDGAPMTKIRFGLGMDRPATEEQEFQGGGVRIRVSASGNCFRENDRNSRDVIRGRAGTLIAFGCSSKLVNQTP